MSLRFIVIMSALTLITLGLAYSVIQGSGSPPPPPRLQPRPLRDRSEPQRLRQAIP
jgi:hypothetical protein